MKNKSRKRGAQFNNWLRKWRYYWPLTTPPNMYRTKFDQYHNWGDEISRFRRPRTGYL